MKKKNLHISYESFVTKLADRLFRLRKDAGYSQEKVASDAWIARLTYRKYERAESNIKTPMNPEISTLIAIANVYGISVLELLDVNDEFADAYSHINKESVEDTTPEEEKVNLTPEEFGSLFGKRLQELRWECDMSQEHAARAAGISSNSYYLLEKGESRPGTPANPHLKTLIGLANAFSVSLIGLLDLGKPQKDDKEKATAAVTEEEWFALI